MQEVLPIFLSEGGELRTQQNELDRIKVIALSAAVPPHYHIVLGTEGFNIALAPEGPESRDDNLLDVHCHQMLEVE